MQEADNTAYIAKAPQQQEALINQHLNASDQLEKMKKMLLGFEYDDEEDEWKPAQIFLGYNEENKAVYGDQGPLMDPQKVRVIIQFLEMYLNSNTFLSKLSQETGVLTLCDCI